MPLKRLYIELTTSCNLKCMFCYRNNWRERDTEMDSVLFRKMTDEARTTDSLKSVVLGGIGEPTNSPLIGEALAAFGGFHLTVTTNGIDIKNEILASIAVNANLVMISIDGLADGFYKIRGTELGKVLDTIKKLKSLDGTPEIGIQFVLSRTSVDDLPKVIELAGDLGVYRLVVSNILPQTREQAEEILYTRYENKLLKELFSRLSNRAVRRGISLFLPNCELKSDRLCAFVENDAAFVTATGEVVPCFRLSHDYTEYVFGREKSVCHHPFGNLRDSTLREIWESPGYERFRVTVRGNRYPSCLDCDLADGCDMVLDTVSDCHSSSPSCADCLWTRNFTVCP